MRAGPLRLPAALKPDVLIVDDSLTVRMDLAHAFETVGCAATVCATAAAARSALERTSYALIVLDVLLPDTSGIELLAEVKSDPACRDIPLVMLTAMEEREAMIDGITAGADDYVTKSADFAVLKARVGAKLRRKQIEDENRIIRERLLRKEMEAAEARAARALAETRGALLVDLERQYAALACATVQEREAHEALKRAQSQLVQSEKLAALGQMVAGVAHEINNPLSFVVNDMAVLQRDVVAVRELVGLYRQAATAAGGDGPELQRRIRAADERIDVDHTLGGLDRLLLRAREGLRRIEGIVKDLRGFARLDEGERNEADLNAGVVSTVNIVRERAAKRNIAIALELGRLPPVICHGAKINQVVLNLIANAIDACADGGSVTVRTACEQGGIAIHVIDSSKGIDPEIRGRIFDPFFTTKPIGEGTGLGLSISYGIAQEHGGTIDVDSTPGCGACFTLRLPIGADAERRSRPGGATEGAAAPR